MLEGLPVIDLVNLNLKKNRPPLFRRSAPPFIDKGDGFTGERERVRMFLCLVAHADKGSDDGRRPQYC